MVYYSIGFACIKQTLVITKKKPNITNEKALQEHLRCLSCLVFSKGFHLNPEVSKTSTMKGTNDE